MTTASLLRSLFVFTCLCGLGALPVAAQSKKSKATVDMNVRKLDDLSISIPAGWLELPQGSTLLTVRSPTDGLKVLVTSTPLTTPTTAERLLEQQQADALAMGFTIRGSGEIKHDGGRMSWLAVTPKSPATPKDAVTKIDFIAERGDQSFVVQCLTADERYEEDLPLFKTIAESVRFNRRYSPLPGAEPRVSEERQQGRRIGQYLIWGIVLWGAYVVLRRLLGT